MSIHVVVPAVVLIASVVTVNHVVVLVISPEVLLLIGIRVVTSATAPAAAPVTVPYLNGRAAVVPSTLTEYEVNHVSTVVVVTLGDAAIAARVGRAVYNVIINSAVRLWKTQEIPWLAGIIVTMVVSTTRSIQR